MTSQNGHVPEVSKSPRKTSVRMETLTSDHRRCLEVRGSGMEQCLSRLVMV